MSLPVVALCGSRALPSAAVPQVGRTVSALLAARSLLSVGCSAGADAAVLSAAVADRAAVRLQVWAAFGPVSPPWSARRYSAPGAWSGSALAEVAAALLAGAAVRWWSGGGPDVPLSSRLVRRSLACVQSAAAGGAGSGLVAFVAALPPRAFGPGVWPSCGSGSWASAAAAALLGLSVVVVPVGQLAGVSRSSLPALPGGGFWLPVLAGPLSSGFRWASQ